MFKSWTKRSAIEKINIDDNEQENNIEIDVDSLKESQQGNKNDVNNAYTNTNLNARKQALIRPSSYL